MSTTWQIKARELANCNCAYGCPCQFNALPTHGNCRAVIGYQIGTRAIMGMSVWTVSRRSDCELARSNS